MFVFFGIQYTNQHVMPLQEVKIITLEDDGSKRSIKNIVFFEALSCSLFTFIFICKRN